jgi:ATP-dependent DNA ligase
MLARSGETLRRVLGGGGVYEPKWDGYRGLLFVTDAGVRVQSRRGADLTRGFPGHRGRGATPVAARGGAGR